MINNRLKVKHSIWSSRNMRIDIHTLMYSVIVKLSFVRDDSQHIHSSQKCIHG